MSRNDRKGPEVVLYHAPPSFYSQIARLALAEKGVGYFSRIVVPGPPLYETYEPWYMEINPGGTVPTLVVDGHAIADSRDILDEVDRQFEGPPLRPAAPPLVRVMTSWIERSYAIPERVIAYGSGRTKTIGRRVNAGRRRALVRMRNRHPQFQSLYEAKIEDIERFMAEARDDDFSPQLHTRLGEAFDELDAMLAERSFICDDTYSLADVVWTVVVARRCMSGDDPTASRPGLARWYARMKERPSYASADIWERFRPLRLLPVLVRSVIGRWTKIRSR